MLTIFFVYSTVEERYPLKEGNGKHFKLLIWDLQICNRTLYKTAWQNNNKGAIDWVCTPTLSKMAAYVNVGRFFNFNWPSYLDRVYVGDL